MRAWLWGEAAWRDFKYLVMPAECVVCGREDAAICPGCARALRRQCGTPFRAEQSADALVGVLGQVLVPVAAAAEYRDAMSAAILAFKNHGRTELGPELGRCLARAIAALPALLPETAARPIVLVPVPSTGSGWRRRGYDPVAALLRAAVREQRLPSGFTVGPVLAHKLRAPWHSRHQKGLGRAARRRNVRNTLRIGVLHGRRFRPGATLDGAFVVVVDDVLTTGSTVREAAKTLEKAGAVVCGAVVLAAARAPTPGAGAAPGAGLAKNSFAAKDE